LQTIKNGTQAMAMWSMFFRLERNQFVVNDIQIERHKFVTLD